MRDAVIVSSVRTPVGKASRGALRSTRPDDLAAIAMKEAIRRVPGLNPADIEDVILGCAMPEGEAGMNIARIASQRAGLPAEVPAITINRFCSSGLQAIAMAAERIMVGHADVILAGGAESMSMIPMGGNKVSPNPWLMDHYPDAYLSMGLTAENVAKKYGITREKADEFSLASHKESNCCRIVAGKFKDEIAPVEVQTTVVANAANGRNAKAKTTTALFEIDEGPRADTSMEALARLKPAFHAHGTTTAGNSSQTSDGAAASIVMSAEQREAAGVKPLARFFRLCLRPGCAGGDYGYRILRLRFPTCSKLYDRFEARSDRCD